MLSIKKIRKSSQICMTILLIVIASLLISVSKSSAEDLKMIDPPTTYMLSGSPAPFNGYLVNPSRFEKTIIAIADLQSTKEASELKSRLLAIAEQERALAEDRLEVQKQEAASVEKGLQAKIADLDVWYKKPWFVATGVAVLFIATGVLLP